MFQRYDRHCWGEMFSLSSYASAQVYASLRKSSHEICCVDSDLAVTTTSSASHGNREFSMYGGAHAVLPTQAEKRRIQSNSHRMIPSYLAATRGLETLYMSATDIFQRNNFRGSRTLTQLSNIHTLCSNDSSRLSKSPLSLTNRLSQPPTTNNQTTLPWLLVALESLREQGVHA
jgi:hypothetical protein